MEGLHLVIISVISGIFTLIGLVFYSHSKYKYMDIKGKWKIREINARKKAKLPPTTRTESPQGSLSGLLSLAKGLDPEQIRALIDLATGGDSVSPGGIGDVLEDIVAENPELVKSFLKGLTGGKSEPQKEEGFPGQL